jgi:hypothetical protein
MNTFVKSGVFLFISILLISSFQNCSKVESVIDSELSLFQQNQNINSSRNIGGSLRNLSDGSLNPDFGNGSISASVLGSELTISTTARLAGAIGSLTFRGKEYINDDDHGRELQSASSYNGLGECLNPTEAGSDTDGSGAVSTSRLLAYSNQGKQLKTATQMAYWLTANQDYGSQTQNDGRGCGNNPNIKKAQNLTNVSNDILHKQVTIGFSNLSNVIEYLVTFQVAESHQSATFEALTGYMGRDFSSFWTYDPKADQLKTLSSELGEQALPVILSTLDKNHAMGIYSPELPQSTFPNHGYGRFNFFQYNTMKWNAVYRTAQTPAGDYNFRQYVIVGTLLEVQSSMKKLHRVFYPDPVVNTPIDGGWTLWSNQGECSQLCGGGLQNQVRSCTSPAPANGGAYCGGASSQQIGCNMHACTRQPKENPNQIVMQNNYRFLITLQVSILLQVIIMRVLQLLHLFTKV